MKLEFTEDILMIMPEGLPVCRMQMEILLIMNMMIKVI